jgi:hypothetical protein
VKLRIIHNFITYSKIKKIVIKSIRTKCEEKTIEGAILKFYRSWRKIQREQRRKRNGHRCQTNNYYDTHVAPPCRGFWFLSNTTPEGAVWWPNDLTYVALTASGSSTCYVCFFFNNIKYITITKIIILPQTTSESTTKPI